MTGPARPDLDAIKARHAVYHDGELALDRCRVCALVAWVEALTTALRDARLRLDAVHDCGTVRMENHRWVCGGCQVSATIARIDALLPPPAPR